MSSQGGGENVAKLDIVIDAPGAAQAKSDAVGALDAITSAAATNGTTVDASKEAWQRWRDQMRESARQANQAARDTDELTAAQRALKDAGLSLDDVLSRINGSARSSRAALAALKGATDDAADSGDKAAKANKQVTDSSLEIGRAHMAALAAQDALDGKFIESSKVVLAHVRALEMEAERTRAAAAANESAGFAMNAHGLQAGRLRQELGTLVGRITGTNTAVDRMAGALGSMAAGNGIIIGVLAGVAAISFAWEHLKSDADRFAESVSKAMEKVRGETLKSQLAMGDAQLAAAQKIADDARKRFEDAQAGTARYNPGLGGTTNIVDDFAVAKAKKALDAALAQLSDFQQQKSAIDYQIRADASQNAAAMLAILVKSGHDEGDARGRALALYKANEAEIARLGQTQTDNVRRVALIQQDATLHDALFPKQKVQIEAEAVARTALATALDKQLDEMRKVNTEGNAAFAKSAEETALIGKEGEARDYLVSRYDAETQRMQALATLSGGALTQRLADIDALQKENAERIRQTEALKNAEERQKALNDAVKTAADVGARNQAAIKAQAEAANAQREAYERVRATLAGDLLHGIEDFATKGLTSYKTFFNEVASLSTRMVDQINKAMVDGARKLSQAQIAQLQQYQSVAAGLGAGASGGIAGYQIGAQTGSASAGFFGGAASGAAAGAAFGPWGGVIGGLTGAVGGLLGASDSQKVAAKTLQDASAAFAQNILSAQANLYGGTYQQDAQIAQAKADAQKLIDQAEALRKEQIANTAGKYDSRGRLAPDQAAIDRYNAEYQDALKKINQLEADRIAQLKREADALTASNIQDYNQRTLTANASGGSLEAQNFAAIQKLQLDEAREMVAAINRHASQDELNALAAAQAAERRSEEDREAAAIRQRDQDVANAAIQAKLDQATADRQAQIDILNAQLKTASDALETARAQLQTQQQAVQATQQVVDTLTKFSQSLKVGQYSTLSPIDQLNEAQRQRDALFQQARAGDQTAAQDFTTAAQTYLQLAQSYFASSPGYASAFSSTQSETSQLTDQYGQQLDVQQSILATLQSSNDKLGAQVNLLQNQLSIAQDTRADDLIAKINGSTDSNEVTRLITELQGLGYMTGRNAPQGADGSYYPSGGYFIASHPGVGAWTPQYGTPGGGNSYDDSTGQYSAPPAGSASASATASSANTTQIVAGLQTLVARQDATIAVLQAGMKQMIATQQATVTAVDDNTLTTRRGLEDVVAVRR